ncbi:MAG: alkaline phosphatase family protein [Fidelibacterota bacterium]
MVKNNIKQKGIVIIQIDGLSKNHLKAAIEKKKMPFLARLLTKKKYEVYPMYTGVPTTTPAVQGELFYGIKTIVPSFSFRDHEIKEIRRMYFPEDATRVEEKLSGMGEPLLKNGSSYGNIYSGGALKANYCIVSFGKERLLKALSIKNIVMNLYNSIKTFLKSVLFLVAELVLGIYDFIKGLFYRNNFFQEFKFIGSRLAITILLRDRMKDSVKYDIRQGIEIMHVNFMGYDEHAHRRGPSSGFAYWVLKGIDRAIKDIWKTAQKSRIRDYKVIIISDHGQEDIISYSKIAGKSMNDAIDGIFVNDKSDSPDEKHGIQNLRSVLLGKKFFQNLSFFINFKNSPQRLIATAIGPMGHIYLEDDLSPARKEEYAERLVREAKIPLVLYTGESEKVMAAIPEGVYELAGEKAKVLGEKHPYLKEVATDLERVVDHEDAGDFVISGWRPDDKPVSFVVQNGAHGGPGMAETDAFVLKPNSFDMKLPEERPYYKLNELRQGILKYLERV